VQFPAAAIEILQAVQIQVVAGAGDGIRRVARNAGQV